MSAFCVKYHFHQFASYLLKMSFTGKEKAFCVLKFDKNNSWTCVQREFRTEFSKQSPDRCTIQKWHAKFKEEGCLCSRKRIAPSPSTETIERVRNIFQRSLRKSIRRASRELQMSSMTQVTKALINIDPDMLVRVWQEMEYRFDVCHVTKGSHIEHL